MSGTVPLVEAVRSLRDELYGAIAAGEGHALQFELGEIELEFNVVVTREGSGQGKLSFKILQWGPEVGVEARLSDERTQRVKINLRPTLGNSEKLMIRSNK